MEMRVYGRTGMRLSVLGFGCGAVGGLMVRGDPRDQERTIARALAVGRELLRHRGPIRRRRVREEPRPRLAKPETGRRGRRHQSPLPRAEVGRIAPPSRRSLDGSLARLRRERVDIFHLHNCDHGRAAAARALGVAQVLDEVGAGVRAAAPGRARPAFSASPRSATRRRCTGSSTPAASTARRWSTTCSIRRRLRRCRRIIRRRIMSRLFDHTKAAGTGVIGIRVLAGGALSGSAERHPIASPPPEPIGSAMSYDADIARARRLHAAGRAKGLPHSLTEAATRFAIGRSAVEHHPGRHGDAATVRRCAGRGRKGPLPPAALERLETLRQGFAGEPR